MSLSYQHEKRTPLPCSNAWANWADRRTVDSHAIESHQLHGLNCTTFLFQSIVYPLFLACGDLLVCRRHAERTNTQAIFKRQTRQTRGIFHSETTKKTVLICHPSLCSPPFYFDTAAHGTTPSNTRYTCTCPRAEAIYVPPAHVADIRFSKTCLVLHDLRDWFCFSLVQIQYV